MIKHRKIRVGAVSYLNTKPLVYGLEQRSSEIDLVYDLPSRLADDLARGRLDVALIPSVEYFQDPSYRIVSDACIACRGPVLSVKLLSRRPIHEVRSLALDEGSRTSVALVRVLLKQRYGITPQFESLPIGAEASRTTTDAVLLIGDRAIHPPEGFVEEWDLGEQWCVWSGLPFVFAMWTARPDTELGELEPALAAARDEGLAHLDEIAATWCGSVNLTHEQCVGYLRDNLHFYLGASERRGLELFQRYATELALVTI